ncbi:hypothetical protein KY340_01435 [Candidatus Woesearchaeota archaeon]|nr:hypothetical protein [Candidatus Woesearchaeota archaeon]
MEPEDIMDDEEEITELEAIEISLDDINETLQKIVSVLEKIEQKLK